MGLQLSALKLETHFIKAQYECAMPTFVSKVFYFSTMVELLRRPFTVT